MEQCYKKMNCLNKSIFNNKDPPPQHLASTFLCSGLNNNITQIIKLFLLPPLASFPQSSHLPSLWEAENRVAQGST